MKKLIIMPFLFLFMFSCAPKKSTKFNATTSNDSALITDGEECIEEEVIECTNPDTEEVTEYTSESVLLDQLYGDTDPNLTPDPRCAILDDVSDIPFYEGSDQNLACYSCATVIKCTTSDDDGDDDDDNNSGDDDDDDNNSGDDDDDDDNNSGDDDDDDDDNNSGDDDDDDDDNNCGDDDDDDDNHNGNHNNNGHGNNHHNNGHGNNQDGVDVSNPGQGHGGPNGQEDPSGEVDDEN